MELDFIYNTEISASERKRRDDKKRAKTEALLTAINDPDAEDILYEILKRRQKRDVDDGILARVKQGLME